jgi:protein-S-isoprenylcysteine O-methyltransferase Ste14
MLQSTLEAAPRRRLLLLFMGLWGAFLVLGWTLGPFIAAGTLNWPVGWVYFAVVSLGLVGHRAHVARHNRALLERRQRIGAGTKTWDLVWNLPFWPLMIAVPVTAGIDFRAARVLPLGCWAIGLGCFGAGLSLSAWAMGHNPHFEGTVRIQRELCHRVVTTGPYRFIRHPGYAGLCLWALGTPFLLLSTTALYPAAAVTVWLVIRTMLEDRFLQRELAGYAEFAKSTRFRLLPGVW